MLPRPGAELGTWNTEGDSKDEDARTGDVPGDWKHANVTPIFKKGTKGDPANYRPVSLTSIPCKIFESILKDRIMEHLFTQLTLFSS